MWHPKHVGMALGVDFINFLRTTFTREEPKCVTKTVKLSVFLRSTRVKAERKCVGEIDTWSLTIEINVIVIKVNVYL
jgi:hypothetical protein